MILMMHSVSATRPIRRENNCNKINLTVKSLENHSVRESILAMAAAIVVGFGVMGLKFYGYWITGSAAILSDALESIINVVAAIFAFGSVLLSAKPPDETHPYGHGKIEFFSAGFEGALIVLCSWRSFRRRSLADPQSSAPPTTRQWSPDSVGLWSLEPRARPRARQGGEKSEVPCGDNRRKARSRGRIHFGRSPDRTSPCLPHRLLQTRRSGSVSCGFEHRRYGRQNCSRVIRRAHGCVRS